MRKNIYINYLYINIRCKHLKSTTRCESANNINIIAKTWHILFHFFILSTTLTGIRVSKKYISVINIYVHMYVYINNIYSEDGVVRLCHSLVNLYIWLTISSCYGSIPLTLVHGCGFTCQQRVLKTFPGPGYLHSEDGVVRLCHSLVNLYMSFTKMSKHIYKK